MKDETADSSPFPVLTYENDVIFFYSMISISRLVSNYVGQCVTKGIELIEV